MGHETSRAKGIRRNVLVIGASSSVGPSLVQAFVEAGDQVMATYRASPLPTSDRATAVHLDLLDAASRAAFAARVAALPQTIDVIVLLPGIIAGLSLADYPEGKIDEV